MSKLCHMNLKVPEPPGFIKQVSTIKINCILLQEYQISFLPTLPLVFFSFFLNKRLKRWKGKRKQSIDVFFLALAPWTNSLEIGIITRKHVLSRDHFPNKISYEFNGGWKRNISDSLKYLKIIFQKIWFWQYLLHTFFQPFFPSELWTWEGKFNFFLS